MTSTDGPGPDPGPVLLPGAEPYSAPGGPHGALVVHGFTGSPQSLRGLAEGLAAAGFAVELPRLPGHGTTPDDMAATRWPDWAGAAEGALDDLARRCDRVVIAGLSMGGTIATWLAAHRPDVPIAGLVLVNPAVEPPGEALFDIMRQTLAQGVQFAPAVGNDVADPAVRELAYDRLPVEAALSLFEAQRDLAAQLPAVTCPVLLFTSRQDHVVPTSSSDFLAEHVGGPVERMWLERSYHVATIDYDRDLIAERAVEFARKVTAA